MAYESYCWNVGTTSFRRKGMNAEIETQLLRLGEFWRRPENDGATWQNNPPLQERFYAYLKACGFLSGDALRPDKDARQKTSVLRELGFVNDGRSLTPAGWALMRIAQKGDFRRGENLLDLPPDSDVYFRQFLKSAKSKGGWTVRPFVLLLWLMTQVRADSDGRKALTRDEFAYLLPLCTSREFARYVVLEVNIARQKKEAAPVERIVCDTLMSRGNYKEALHSFLAAKRVDADVICALGMNRDSGGTDGGRCGYDRCYLSVYRALRAIALGRATPDRIVAFLKSLGGLRGVKSYWTRRFFRVARNGRATAKNAADLFNADLPVCSTMDEKGFRVEFFRLVHTFKAMCLLDDYADLNVRLFRLSDAIVFRDESVELDPLVSAFAYEIEPWLAANSFSASVSLSDDLPLEKIVACPLPTKESLAAKALSRLGTEAKGIADVRKSLEEERGRQFRSFLQQKFSQERVAVLLEKLEDRANDEEVRDAVSSEATIPTIFEYLVAVAWYYVSERPVGALDYMNLSLGADFLPKTHAGGGVSDIEWRYADAPPAYPRHTLLIEVTMAEKDSQRHLEMESVSRHLGKFLLANAPDATSYCLFVTPHLDLNVIAAFRAYRKTPYYESGTAKAVESLKIVPIDTKTLRTALSAGLTYRTLYSLFEEAYRGDAAPPEWCERIREAISRLPQGMGANAGA